MADFGWSASCIVEAIKTANKIRKALQESGGAKEHYAETVAFLGQIDATFKHLERHIEEHPDSPSRDAIVQQLKLMEVPWKRIEAMYVEKYEKSLGGGSMRSRLRQTPRMVQWAMNDVDAAVRKERVGILEPLGMIGSLLSLDLMKEIQGLSTTCKKIIDAAKVDDLSLLVEKCWQSIDNHIFAEDATHGKWLERVDELQGRIEDQYSNLVELMRALRTETTSQATYQSAGFEILARDATEFTSIIKRVYSKLQYPIASLDSIELELEEQKGTLDMMQRTLEALIAYNKAPSADILSRHSDGVSYTWVEAGKILATTVSAFAGGYSAVRMGAFSTAGEEFAQEVGRSSVNLPNHQLSDRTRGMESDTSMQHNQRSYQEWKKPSRSEEFQEKGCNDSTSFMQMDAETSLARVNNNDESSQRHRNRTHHQSKRPPESSHQSSRPQNTGKTGVANKSRATIDEVWYCSGCGEGPIPGWNPVCVSCGDRRAEEFTQGSHQTTLGPPPGSTSRKTVSATSPYSNNRKRKSDKYDPARGLWYCCQCKSGPHTGSHCFCTKCRHRCDRCKIEVVNPWKEISQMMDSGESDLSEEITSRERKSSAQIHVPRITDGRSDLWYCEGCGAENSSWYDCCPICGAYPSSL